MFDSSLTVYVVIYIIVQGKYCSKLVTTMNDNSLIVMNMYHDKTFLASTMKSSDKTSWPILCYGPVLS